MLTARRIANLPAYVFADVNRRIAAKRAAGHDVISFGAGDPDLPTPAHIVQRLTQAAAQPENHRYPPYDGVVELRRAVSDWYHHRFGVTLDPDRHVVPLMGAKEGIGHVALALLDPGDTALIPSPGYPTYQIGTLLAGGECHSVPLSAADGFLPRLDDIPGSVVRAAKLIWLNYPNNPTAAVAQIDFLEQVVRFARENDLVVLYDNAYSEVTFDGFCAPSFLQVPGAIDVGVEFHSLSKTYNMPGWRMGMVVGNETIVSALAKVKTHYDTGIFLPLQFAAATALTGPQDWIGDRNLIYQRRRDRLVTGLKRLGWDVALPRASLYVWGRVPGQMSSVEFSLRLLEDFSIFLTPGSAYGRHGEGYFRASITLSEDRIDEAIARLGVWG